MVIAGCFMFLTFALWDAHTQYDVKRFLVAQAITCHY